MTQSRRQVLRAFGAGGLTVFGGVASAQETTPAEGEAARVRVLHAIPDAPAVDVFVDGDPVLEGVEFTDVSDYLELEPGEYTFAVAPAGEGRQGAILEQQATLESNTAYTVAAGGRLDSPEVFLFVDQTEAPSGDQARLRAVHLSPDAPAVDVAADGDVLVEGLEFGNASDYLDVPAGSYTLEIRPAGADQAVGTFDVTLEGGVVVSAFAVGLVETDDQAQSLDLVTAVDVGGGAMTTTT